MLRRERQDHAAEIMMDAARKITADRVEHFLRDYGGTIDAVDVDAIRELAEKADITVEWAGDRITSGGGR